MGVQACQHGSCKHLSAFVTLVTPESRIKKNTRGKGEKREGKRGGGEQERQGSRDVKQRIRK